MRPFLYLLTALAVMSLALWAYQENYKTQSALSEVEQLNRQIGETRAAIGVLRAEWAYLNRPDRLRELALLNFRDLQLVPLAPDQFVRADQIRFPPPVAEIAATETDDILQELDP